MAFLFRGQFKNKFSPDVSFGEWVKTATEGDLGQWARNLPTPGREIDFTTPVWGHCFNVTDKIGLVVYGYGFYNSIVYGSIRLGDSLLMNTESGKLGVFLVLSIKYCDDPKDMFWAYIACVGYKAN
jgi:hypothetical protein